MNLQKRIFRLNMFMLIISLVAMLGISVYVVNNLYLHRSSQMTSSQKTAASQTSVEQFSGTDFAGLANQLAANGAQLYVSHNGQTVYSTLQEDVEDVTNVSVSQTTHISYVEDEIVISREMEADGKSYRIYALIEDTEDQQEINEFQSFLLQIAVIGGVSILLIVGINFIFTKRILKVILLPLDELHQGVERIQDGNYQIPIHYQGDREFEDLTQGFNQMQKSLLETKEQNERYEQNRTQMVADISHDLRTPLTSIKGYAKGILDGVANTEEKKKQYLSIIYQKSQVMEKLLEKLFVFSQLETDKLPFDCRNVELRTVLQEYVAEKEAELADEKIRFEVNLPEELPTSVDLVQFRRILDNLVDNARKYANVEQLVLTIEGWTRDNQVIWTFADNGCGVEADKLPALFDEFYRVDQARQQVDGHGLGLSIIKNIMTRLGGSVEVANQGGLRFTFFLPRKDAR